MKMSAQIDALTADLQAVAGDDAASRAALDRLVRALELSLRVRLLDLIGEAAAELSSQLPAGRVEVRLEGADPALVYVADPEAGPALSHEDDQPARITLRLPERLKASAEAAAAREAISVNAWLVRAVGGALDSRPASRHRLQGYARS